MYHLFDVKHKTIVVRERGCGNRDYTPISNQWSRIRTDETTIYGSASVVIVNRIRQSLVAIWCNHFIFVTDAPFECGPTKLSVDRCLPLALPDKISIATVYFILRIIEKRRYDFVKKKKFFLILTPYKSPESGKILLHSIWNMYSISYQQKDGLPLTT